MLKLRDRLAVIGARGSPLSLRHDLYWFRLLRDSCHDDSHRPASVRALMDACVDPKVSEWKRVGPTMQVDNQHWTENCQGITPGSGGWYVSTNAGNAGEDDREGLYYIEYGARSSTATRLKCPLGPKDVHPGALCVSDGWVYVPLQPDAESAKAAWGDRRAVWKVREGLSAQVVLWTPPMTSADPLPNDNLFAWCDINPHNKLFYTCHFDDPNVLWAYDASSTTDASIMPRCPRADIPLKFGARRPANVQGACFTRNYRLVLICDVDPQFLQVYSTLSGHLLGEMPFIAASDDTWNENELESVRVCEITVAGVTSHLQVLELNNEAISPDDIYLWGVTVPDPATL